MSDLHLVFSRRLADVARDAYAAYYLRHLQEILRAAGWVRARAYDLDAPQPFTTLDVRRPGAAPVPGAHRATAATPVVHEAT